jgi:hypothetical protein
MRRGVMVPLILAIALVAPAAASAASSSATGSASFYKATGGLSRASVHAGGLVIGRSSPAYVVLKANTQVSGLESYAANNTFPVVGIVTGGRVQCFTGANLLTGHSFASSFTDGGNRYRGLLLTYTNHFTLSGSQAGPCRSHHSLGAILPTVSLTKSSAKLQITCLIRYCSTTFAAFKPPNTCQGPVRLLPGVSGCSPAFSGFSKAPGGLTDTVTIPLKAASTNVMRIVLVVNGKTVVSSRLLALKRSSSTPPRPKTSSVSISCSAAKTGVAAKVASGTVTPHGRGTVVVTFTGPSGTTPVTFFTATDGQGRWSASLTPSAARSWTATAVFIGDRSRKAAVSKACPFTVTP